MGNEFESRNRERKAARFILALDQRTRDSQKDPKAPQTAAEIVRQLDAATPEKWEQLSRRINEKPPSIETRLMIRGHYSFLASRTEQPSGLESDAAMKARGVPGSVFQDALGLCQCGKPRDDKTDRLCLACQLNEFQEGRREWKAAAKEGLNP